MATVTNTIVLLDGSTPQRAAVEISLVSSPTGGVGSGWLGDTALASSTVRPTVSNGSWSADLEPNEGIDPPGTAYRIREYANGKSWVSYIEVPPAGGAVHDLLVDRPSSVQSSALAAHAADSSTHGVSGEIVGTTNQQTLSSKTLTNPAWSFSSSAGISARLALKVQRESAVNPLDKGAAGDGVTDDFAVLQGLLDAGGEIWLSTPPESYRITDTLVVSKPGTILKGSNGYGFSQFSNPRNSRIVLSATDRPALQVETTRVAIRDLAVECATRSTNPASYGLVYSGVCSSCEVSEVYFRNLANGIGLDQSKTSAVFVSSFRDIRIQDYSVTALDLRSNGGGGTPCSFDNVYIHAGSTTYPIAAPPVRLFQCHGYSFTGLHVESAALPNGVAVEIEDCFSTSFSELHVENVTVASSQSTSGFGLVSVVGGNHQNLKIYGMVVQNSDWNSTGGVGSAYLVYTADCTFTTVIADGIVLDPDTVTVEGVTCYPFGMFGGTTNLLYARAIDLGSVAGFTNQVNGTAQQNAVAYNGAFAFMEIGSTVSTSLRVRQFADSAAPTSGSWRRGDIVWNVSPSAAGQIGWVCVSAGTPGTWKTFGVIAS